jgi:hypothetical protein
MSDQNMGWSDTMSDKVFRIILNSGRLRTLDDHISHTPDDHISHTVPLYAMMETTHTSQSYKNLKNERRG